MAADGERKDRDRANESALRHALEGFSDANRVFLSRVRGCRLAELADVRHTDFDQTNGVLRIPPRAVD
jgi:hypothetical protein